MKRVVFYKGPRGRVYDTKEFIVLPVQLKKKCQMLISYNRKKGRKK